MKDFKLKVLSNLISIEEYELADIINNSELLFGEPFDYTEDYAIITLTVRAISKFYKTISDKSFKNSATEQKLYDLLEQEALKDGYHINNLHYEVLANETISKLFEGSSSEIANSIEISKPISVLENSLKTTSIKDSTKREIENSIKSFKDRSYTTSAKILAPIMEELVDKLLDDKNLLNIHRSKTFSEKLKVLSDENVISVDLFNTFKIHNIRNAVLHGNINPDEDRLVLPVCLTNFIVTDVLINELIK